MIEKLLAFVKAQKTHIIYGAIIVVLAGVAYRFFKKDPTIITQTKTVVKTVEKVIVQKVFVHDNIVTNRTIQTKKPDGTVTTETEQVVNLSTSQSVTQEKKDVAKQVTEKTVTSFLAKYTLSVMYPIPRSELFHPSFEAKNTELILGYRLGNLPVLLNVGTNFGLNTVLVGITLEL